MISQRNWKSLRTDRELPFLATVSRALEAVSTSEDLFYAGASGCSNLGAVDNLALAHTAAAVVEEDVDGTHFELKLVHEFQSGEEVKQDVRLRMFDRESCDDLDAVGEGRGDLDA